MAHLSNTATHRANRLLAALEPKDFAYLEPHLEIIDSAPKAGALRGR